MGDLLHRPSGANILIAVQKQRRGFQVRYFSTTLLACIAYYTPLAWRWHNS
jgi:hypothetical protein